MAYVNMVRMAAVLSYCIVDTAKTIEQNDNWMWLENNDDIGCQNTISDLIGFDDMVRVDYEDYKAKHAPIWIKDHPGAFAACKNQSDFADETEFAIAMIERDVNDYATYHQNLHIQLYNLKQLLVAYKQGNDLTMDEVFDLVNNEDGPATFWELEDPYFAKVPELVSEKVFGLFDSLATKAEGVTPNDLVQGIKDVEIDQDATEIMLLAAWGQGRIAVG